MKTDGARWSCAVSGVGCKRNGGSQRCPASNWADNIETTRKCFDTVLESDESRPAADNSAAEPVVADGRLVPLPGCARMVLLPGIN